MVAKTYERNDAIETLRGILAIQDKAFLANELAKLVVKHISNTSPSSLHFKELDMDVINNGKDYSIKIGNEQ
jgi:uncharacterized protein YhfF